MYKLIVIEDEELLRMGLTTCINWEDAGYELIGEAGDGAKGVELVLEKRPDIVITDIKMPHMSGLEMTERLKAELPDLKVVIISGYDDFEYAKRAIQAGVSEYILKPINIENLLEAMRRLRNTLTEERQKQVEYLELKQSHNRELRLKRTDLYRKILLHQNDMASLAGERQKLGSYVENRFYAVGLVSVKNFSTIYVDCDYSLVMQKDKELHRTLETKLSKLAAEELEDSLELLRPNRGERLICVSGETKEAVSGGITQIVNCLQSETDDTEEVEVSFGKVRPNLEGLRESYADARNLCEQKLMRKWQQAADFSAISDQLTQAVNNLCLEIRSGSQKDVEAAIEALKDELLRQNIASYLHLVLVVSNIYYALIKMPAEIGGSIAEVLDNPQTHYQKLVGLMNREEMLSALGDMCLRLHQYFRNQLVDRKQEIMKQINRYLQEHFSDMDLSMKDVANYTYVSVSYLGMIIRQETGKTFIEHLTDIRIERAKHYLKNTDMKNYEIAEMCGYSTPAYFSTVFKAACGVTPREYRNAAKQKI